MQKKIISFVIPVFNEEENIIRCYEAINQAMSSLSAYEIEYIFTDNHSTDNSFAILQSLANKDQRVKVLRYSKNFGYQRSIMTGLVHASGDAVIIYDCDLQDPPHLFREFIQCWEDGSKVVYGIRRSRKESRLVEFTRKLYYRLINSLSDDFIPPDAGDFRLLDQVIIKQIKTLGDPKPYLRGTIAGLGFKQTGISYDREKRLHGVSKFPFIKMFSLALDGIISQSIVPLRIATFTGLSISFLTLVGIVFYIILYLFAGVSWPHGFTTLTVLILFSVSINALFLGIIGEYLGRIYQHSKGHPLTIIEQALNINTTSA